MKKATLWFFLLAGFFVPFLGKAQAPPSLITGTTPPPPQLLESEKPFQPSFGVGLVIGASALPGVDMALNVAYPINLRVGFHHVSFSIANLELDPNLLGFMGPKIIAQAEVGLSHLFFAGEWAPTKRRNFRVILGGALALQNELSGQFEFKENLMINDVELTPEEVGFIRGTYFTENLIHPYLGLGFGRLIPRNKLSFGVEAGLFYRGAPKFEIESTELLENNEENALVLEQNLMDWRFQPSVNIRLGFRLY